jgi:hypothetical protein
MDKQINEYFDEWSKKLSVSVSDIEKEFQTFLENEIQIHPDLSEEDRKTRALQRTMLLYKKRLRSPAIGFEGIIIGTSDCVDMVAKQKKDALDLYRANPEFAIAQGFVNEEGIPLDTRKEFSPGRKNPNYGKPLPEHNWVRNIYGIAVKTKNANDKPKIFFMTITGDKAQNESLPLFKKVRFMAIDRTPKESADNLYVLNSSLFTEFIIDDELEFQISDAIEALRASPFFVKIKDLQQYHDSTKNNFNRIAIVEGCVSSLKYEPTLLGNRVMVVEDENLAIEDIEANTGVTCWIPLRIDIDFAEGSKVIVVGRTAQGKKRDEEGNPTEELGDVTLNVYGVYAIPEYKIELPEIEKLTEEDII